MEQVADIDIMWVIAVHPIPVICYFPFVLLRRFALKDIEEALALIVRWSGDAGEFKPCCSKVDVGDDVVAYHSGLDPFTTSISDPREYDRQS